MRRIMFFVAIIAVFGRPCVLVSDKGDVITWVLGPINQLWQPATSNDPTSPLFWVIAIGLLVLGVIAVWIDQQSKKGGGK